MNATSTTHATAPAKGRSAPPPAIVFEDDREAASLHVHLMIGREPPSLLRCVATLNSIDAITDERTSQIDSCVAGALALLTQDLAMRGTPARGTPDGQAQTELFHAIRHVRKLLEGIQEHAQYLSNLVNSDVGDLGIQCAGYDPECEGVQ